MTLPAPGRVIPFQNQTNVSPVVEALWNVALGSLALVELDAGAG